MANVQQNWQSLSNQTLDSGTRNALINNLGANGYQWQTLQNMTNDDLLNLGKQLGESQFQRKQRDADRADALSDFGAQLSALTSSKQRQAEQAGRIAQANTRTQGLAQMMSNF